MLSLRQLARCTIALKVLSDIQSAFIKHLGSHKYNVCIIHTLKSHLYTNVRDEEKEKETRLWLDTVRVNVRG
jgi:hypothetical protein